MEYNLSAFSTEHLAELLSAKLKKPQTPTMIETIEAIRNELKTREEKSK